MYNELLESVNRLSDQIKVTILQKAVHPIPELQNVKSQADQYKVQNKNDITFEQ